MKRSALIASVSTLALVFVGPMPVHALPGDAASWWGRSSVEPNVGPVRKPAKPRARPASKDAPDKTTEKAPPTGLLHVIVSIDKQRATLFADGLPIASTAVSTGTAGHPTPTGLFTIIQKSRHHVSNLYNAPMPYMQRITWSGSALHEGPLPGYPASHGCVRLSSNFAQMLWKATKMSARVIITRPEVAPLEFAHARLFVPTPKLAAAPRGTDAFAADPSDKPSPAKSAAASTIAPPVAAPQPATIIAASPARVKTADASNPAVAVMATIGDASVPTTAGVVTEPTSSATAEQPTKLSVTDGTGGKPESAPETVAAAQPAEAMATDRVPTDSKPAATETVASVPAAPAPVEAAVADTKPVQIDMPKVEPIKAESPKVEAKLAAPASIIVDERPAAMPPAAVKEAKQRPISVFVSLKEGKLYVRQGWQPLFDAPVTFENPGQPIGTHLYTAMGTQADGSGLRWTVVSIPSSTRRAEEPKPSEHGRKPRNERAVKAVEVVAPPMPSPSAALDRIVISPDVVERISEMITPGSSLIVSDNRLSDETGQYTDFIVTTR